MSEQPEEKKTDLEEAVNKASDALHEALVPQNPKIQAAAKSGALDMFGLIIASVALLVAVYAAKDVWQRHSSGAVDVPKVAVVDVDLINASFLTEIMRSNAADPAKQAAELENKSRQLVGVIDKLKADGLIVLNKSAVLSYPEGNDVTATVAKEMGVNLLNEAAFQQQNNAAGTEVTPAQQAPSNGGAIGNANLD